MIDGGNLGLEPERAAREPRLARAWLQVLATCLVALAGEASAMLLPPLPDIGSASIRWTIIGSDLSDTGDGLHILHQQLPNGSLFTGVSGLFEIGPVRDGAAAELLRVELRDRVGTLYTDFLDFQRHGQAVIRGMGFSPEIYRDALGSVGRRIALNIVGLEPFHSFDGLAGNLLGMSLYACLDESCDTPDPDFILRSFTFPASPGELTGSLVLAGGGESTVPLPLSGWLFATGWLVSASLARRSGFARTRRAPGAASG